MGKFRKHKSIPTSFDQNITVLRNGKEIRNYDLIQSGREQSEIFEMDEEQREELGLRLNESFGDQKKLDELSSLRGAFELHERAIEQWKSLPLEIRQKFNNDPAEFANNGADWIKSEIAKAEMAKKQLEEQQKQINEETPKTEKE